MRTFHYLPNLLRHNYYVGFQVTKAVFLASWLSCTKNKEKVVYRESDKYHLILSGLFSNFKPPTIINKLPLLVCLLWWEL